MNDRITENPLAKIIGTLGVSILFFCFGLWCLLDPKQVQERHARNFKMDSEVKWDDPSTYLREPVPLILIRGIGLIMTLFGILGFYLVIFTPA